MTATVNTPSGADGARLVFTQAGELARSAPAAQPPLIVDSWLVEDGAVRALGSHERRFRASCQALLPDIGHGDLDAFLREVRLALPREGRWFPRIEARADPDAQLVVWLRGAPDRQRETRLWASGEPAVRTQPLIKGPDARMLARLRARAREAGADDALLSATDGTVLETDRSALVWWRGGTLCLPDARGSMLPSITQTLLVELAHGRGVDVRRERVVVDELATLEVWALNALHGIRPVSALLGASGTRSMSFELARVRDWSLLLGGRSSAIGKQ